MYRISVKGIVQGVGFRPFIYREAKRLGIKGEVLNKGGAVEIICDDKHFIDKLEGLPPLARIDEVNIYEVAGDHDDFYITKSGKSKGEAILPPDVFTCDECLKELDDKENRRYGYYFITCTNCGPRFTMIDDYPYDRPNTSMNEFEMCEKCREEYGDVMDRRYHAQTIACHECGPSLSLWYQNIPIETGNDRQTIRQAAELIKQGRPLCIKGVGGFHLCSLADDASVAKVRTILGRENKPFAVMTKDIQAAREIVDTDRHSEAVLESPQRPIVTLPKKVPSELEGVSELESLGVMLPYTALHHMLMQEIGQPVVMTSANLPGEPVSIVEEVGSYFLTHSRRIVNRCDDSVMKMINKAPVFLRRSRGYTPLPVALPSEAKPVIALGAELNNTICIAKANKAFLSQHIGDTKQHKTFEFLKEATKRFLDITKVRPDIICCDLHPSFNTSVYAEELAEKFGCVVHRVQHHKAHVAACAAEHGLKDYVGIAADGLGYGEDGNIWGGEVFLFKDGNCRRVGSLEEQPMPGGDSAVLYPKKMLLGILSGTMDVDEIVKLRIFGPEETKLLYRQTKQRFNTMITTSTGRILDSVAAMLDVCYCNDYEGRAPMLLEDLAIKRINENCSLDFKPVIRNEDRKILMTSPLIRHLLSEYKKGTPKEALAYKAHLYLAEGLLEIACAYGLPVVFSGGVAYNRIISSLMEKNGVLLHRDIPPGDGGISYGQIAYTLSL